MLSDANRICRDPERKSTWETLQDSLQYSPRALGQAPYQKKGESFTATIDDTDGSNLIAYVDGVPVHFSGGKARIGQKSRENSLDFTETAELAK